MIFEGALRFSQDNRHKCSLRLLQLIVKIHARHIHNSNTWFDGGLSAEPFGRGEQN